MRTIGMRYNPTASEIIFKIFNCTFLAALALTTFYPFYFILISSLSHPDTMLVSYIWPKQFFFANYYLVLATRELWWAFLISVGRLATAVPAMLLVTSAAAFALSRREMLLRTPIIFYFFITMFFSGGLIPYYITVKAVGLFDSFLVYVIPTLFSVWSMIVMKTSIQTLPSGLVDAALIDGASYIRIHFQVILPLSKAMLAVLGLFAAVGAWNDWFTGLFYVQNPRLRPLQTFLQTEALIRSRDWIRYRDMRPYLDEDSQLYQDVQSLFKSDAKNLSIKAINSMARAYIMVGLVPIVMLYPFLQKYFVKGVLIGSMKE